MMISETEKYLALTPMNITTTLVNRGIDVNSGSKSLKIFSVLVLILYIINEQLPSINITKTLVNQDTTRSKWYSSVESLKFRMVLIIDMNIFCYGTFKPSPLDPLH